MKKDKKVYQNTKNFYGGVYNIEEYFHPVNSVLGGKIAEEKCEQLLIELNVK